MSETQITILPPSEHRYGHGGHAPFYDRLQFAGRRTKAVSAKTGIAFSDFEKMHVSRREVRPVRRLPDPLWVNDDARMKDLVLTFLERRFYLRRGENEELDALAYDERIQGINHAAKLHLTYAEALLDRLQQRYYADSKMEASADYLKGLATEIQNADSTIVMLRRGIVAIAFAVVHYYFKLGWTSVMVAEELGIKPPMVRVWCYRLRHLADGVPDQSKRYRGNYLTVGKNWPHHVLQRLFVLRAQGKTAVECAALMGVSNSSLVHAWRNCFGDLTVQKLTHMKKVRVPLEKKERAKKERAQPFGRPKLKRDLPLRNDVHVKWTSERVEELLRMIEDGNTLGQCAEVLRVSHASASYAYHRASLRYA